MSYSKRSFFCFITCIAISQTFAQIQELTTLTNSLWQLSLQLQQQNRSVSLTEYLSSAIEKTSLRSDKDFISDVVEIAEGIEKKYGNFDKNRSFNIVSLASGGLNKEFLIVLALRQLGYKKIYLTTIDPIYLQKTETQISIKNQFLSWCKTYDIEIQKELREPQPEDGIKLVLYSTALNYIHAFSLGTFGVPKNHLFICIQPNSYNDTAFNSSKILNAIDNLKKSDFAFADVDIFTLANTTNDKNISIYLPYDKTEWFIIPHNIDTNEDKNCIKLIQDNVEQLFMKKYTKNFLYQSACCKFITTKLYKQLSDNCGLSMGKISLNAYFRLADIIRHTAYDQDPIVFATPIFKDPLQILDTTNKKIKDVYLEYFYKR